MGLISRVSSRTYRRIFKSQISKTSTNMVQVFLQGSTLSNVTVATEQDLFNAVTSQESAHLEQLTMSVNGAPFNFETLNGGETITISGKLLGGKVHGSLARAGKVKGQTPKVDKEEKRKMKTGRALRRLKYNRRFNVTASGFGKKKGPNHQGEK